MTPIRKFLRLCPGEQRLLLETVFLLVTIRIGLSLFPFRTLHRFLTRISSVPDNPPNRDQACTETIAWAVATACRLVPKATCLTQALTVQFLLRKHGQRTRIRIGVARNGEGKFEAHAWAENQAGIAIANSDLGRYTLLPPIEVQQP
jgi:hypothetical protein